MKAIEEQNVVQIAKAFSDSVRFSIYRHLSDWTGQRQKSSPPTSARISVESLYLNRRLYV